MRYGNPATRWYLKPSSSGGHRSGALRMAAMAAFRARKPLLDGLASGAVPEAGLAALSDGFRMEANDPADHPNGRRSAARRPPTERVYRPGSNFLEAAPRLGRP